MMIEEFVAVVVAAGDDVVDDVVDVVVAGERGKRTGRVKRNPR